MGMYCVRMHDEDAEFWVDVFFLCAEVEARVKSHFQFITFTARCKYCMIPKTRKPNQHFSISNKLWISNNIWSIWSKLIKLFRKHMMFSKFLPQSKTRRQFPWKKKKDKKIWFLFLRYCMYMACPYSKLFSSLLTGCSVYWHWLHGGKERFHLWQRGIQRAASICRLPSWEGTEIHPHPGKTLLYCEWSNVGYLTHQQKILPENIHMQLKNNTLSCIFLILSYCLVVFLFLSQLHQPNSENFK